MNYGEREWEMRIEFLQTLRKLHETSDRMEWDRLYYVPYLIVNVDGSEQEKYGCAMCVDLYIGAPCEFLWGLSLLNELLASMWGAFGQVVFAIALW